MSTSPYPILSRPYVSTGDTLSITANGVTETITAVDAGTYYGWGGTETLPLSGENSLLAEVISNLTDHSAISAAGVGAHVWTNGYPQANITFTKTGDNAADEIDWTSNTTLAAALGFDGSNPLAINGSTSVDVTGDYALGYMFVGGCQGTVNGLITPIPQHDTSLSQPTHNRLSTNYFVTNHGSSTLLLVEYDIVDDANIRTSLRREVQAWADKAGVDPSDPNNILDVFLDGCADGELIRLYSADSTYLEGVFGTHPIDLANHVTDIGNGRFSVSMTFWQQG